MKSLGFLMYKRVAVFILFYITTSTMSQNITKKKPRIVK